jgi:tRNA(Ile2)-agmatinylcytidine synthase
VDIWSSMPDGSIYHIGIDDTDSSEGMCTTFLVFNLVQRLLIQKCGMIQLIDYPNLIRLNPNIPWKTRGNAALAIRTETSLAGAKLFDMCKTMVRKFSTSDCANSGLVLYEGEQIPEEVSEFSRRALHSVVSVKQAKQLIKRFGMLSLGLRSSQGLVGAVAAIGNQLREDFTFELIGYRRDTSKPRILDSSRILEMDYATRPSTFNSYDEEYDRILILPHGPDPVLFGIRGETPSAVRRAFEMLRPIDNLRGYMMFRSNQGTGEHLKEELNLANAKAYSSGFVKGFVSNKPRMDVGGHVFFPLKNSDGEILCACYEPTGTFRFNAMALEINDEIIAGGGIRKRTSKHPAVLNLEYFQPLHLAARQRWQNPKCPACAAKMDSLGFDQGFRCSHCGYKSKKVKKVRIEIPRGLKKREIYLPPIKAHRHLTKPRQRFRIVARKEGRKKLSRQSCKLEYEDLAGNN